MATKLDLKTRLNKDEAVLTEVVERAKAAEERLAEFDIDSLIEDLRAPLSEVDDSPRKAILDRLAPELEKIAAALEKLVRDAQASAADVKVKIESIKLSWNLATQTERDGVAAVLRQLVEDGHKPDEYLILQANLDRLNKRAEKRKGFDTTHKKLVSERAKLLGQLADIDKQTAKDLREAIRTSNSATSGTVVVKPIASPDREHIKVVVNKHFKTQRTQIHAAIDKDDFSVQSFVAAAQSGSDALVPYGVTGAQAKTLLEIGEPLFRELEEQSVGLAVEVQLNVAPHGEAASLRRLEDLSKGQRATALLLLLLGAPDSPLIIDQPEDDLDNRFVYDGVVQKLRTLKGTRQLVVSTHNANVPVLGDAELLVTLEADGQHGRTTPDGVGSLDDPAVRKYAEDLLEGGKTAFDARKRLYDF